MVEKVQKIKIKYFMFRYGKLLREPGRVMLLDKLEWHGAPLLEMWPRVGHNGVPSDYETSGPSVG